MIKKLSRSKIALILSVLFVMVMMMTACSAIDFKVDFIVDGEVYHTISTNGNEVVKMPTDPSKEGYTFGGWFWDKDVWDKPFTANSLLDAPLSDSMSIFAKWKEIVSRQTITVENPTYIGEALVYGDKLPIITTTTTGGTIALNAGQTLSVGTKDYDWTFTPIDSQNYNWLNTTGTISLTVNKANQTILAGTKLEVVNVTDLTIELTHLGATYEYSIDNNIWQDSKNFSGLAPNTAYTLYARLKETDNFYASPYISTTATTARGCEIISAEGFKIEGRNASRKISNATNSFSFINVIKVSQGATWQVSTDINGVNVIPTKTISLNEGDNTVYILVTAANGEDLSLYTFTIRRRPIHTVICKNADGASFSTQSIEEDSLAVEPTNKPSNSGYDFIGWSFDFNAPITNSVNIEPKWSIITYTITYANLLDGTNPNANKIGYTVLTESIILVAPTRTGYTGAWDIARIDNGSVGNKIITASWTINKYTVSVSSNNTLVGAVVGGGTCDFNSDLTIVATTLKLEYNFLGWYNGNKLLATTSSYTFNTPAENVTYEARWAMDELLTDFTFSSTEKTLTITKYNGVASDVIIPNSVTSIGTYVFNGCGRLTSITIGSGVTSIGQCAFSACSGLTSITIPNSVTSIGQSAFSNCSGLTSITIPNSVTSIGAYAFDNTAWLNNQSDGLIYAGKVAYTYKGTMPQDTAITLHDGTIGISDCAFRFSRGLTSITIPNSVTSIGDFAFSHCSGLTSIMVDEGNTRYRSVGNCIIETNTNTLIGGCKSSIIPADGSVTSIGAVAFYGCSLTSITIPNSVTSIGDSAFCDSSELTSITIGSGVTSIGGWAFAGCGRLTTVYIDSLTVANSINKTSHESLLEKATTIYIKDDLAFSNAYFNTLSLVGTETVNNIVYKKYI